MPPRPRIHCSASPGEELDAFVVRIAPIFDKFTAEHEWEACGELAKSSDGRYGIVVGSVQAALSCITSEENVPDGFVAIGQSVHSHPRTRTVRPTASDLALQRRTGFRGLPYREVESNKAARSFSIPDFNADPGYLVTAGRVLHQQGLKTVRTMGKLESVAPVRNFAQR